MIKKHVNCVDYNGNEYEVDCYFNFNKAELLEKEVATSSTIGFGEYIQKILDEKDKKKLFEVFKMLILDSFGIKSDDGRKFIKNEEIRNDFENSDAYSVILMELVSDENKAAEFFNGIMPKDISDKVDR